MKCQLLSARVNTRQLAIAETSPVYTIGLNQFCHYGRDGGALEVAPTPGDIPDKGDDGESDKHDRRICEISVFLDQTVVYLQFIVSGSTGMAVGNDNNGMANMYQKIAMLRVNSHLAALVDGSTYQLQKYPNVPL